MFCGECGYEMEIQHVCEQCGERNDLKSDLMQMIDDALKVMELNQLHQEGAYISLKKWMKTEGW